MTTNKIINFSHRGVRILFDGDWPYFDAYDHLIHKWVDSQSISNLNKIWEVYPEQDNNAAVVWKYSVNLEDLSNMNLKPVDGLTINNLIQYHGEARNFALPDPPEWPKPVKKLEERAKEKGSLLSITSGETVRPKVKIKPRKRNSLWSKSERNLLWNKPGFSTTKIPNHWEVDKSKRIWKDIPNDSTWESKKNKPDKNLLWDKE